MKINCSKKQTMKKKTQIKIPELKYILPRISYSGWA